MSGRLVSLSPDDPGWTRAWRAVGERYGDPACEDRASGEVWQYMGSVIEGEGGRHEFRHRALPATGARAYWSCPITPGDFLPR